MDLTQIPCRSQCLLDPCRACVVKNENMGIGWRWGASQDMRKDCAETCRFPTGLPGFEEGHFPLCGWRVQKWGAEYWEDHRMLRRPGVRRAGKRDLKGAWLKLGRWKREDGCLWLEHTSEWPDRHGKCLAQTSSVLISMRRPRLSVIFYFNF